MLGHPRLRYALRARLRQGLRGSPWFGLGELPGVPIVLLHGFGGTPAAMAPLGQFLLRALGRPVVALPIGLGLRDLRASARTVRSQVRDLLLHAPCDRVDVVGHSLGGVVAVAVLKQIDRGRQVRSVVALGAPLRGTPAAWLGVAALGGLSPAMWQLLPGSVFLRRLEATPVPIGSKLVAVAAREDRIVPERFAGIGARARQELRCLANVSHMGLLSSRAAFRVAADALGEEVDASAALSA